MDNKETPDGKGKHWVRPQMQRGMLCHRQAGNRLYALREVMHEVNKFNIIHQVATQMLQFETDQIARKIDWMCKDFIYELEHILNRLKKLQSEKEAAEQKTKETENLEASSDPTEKCQTEASCHS